jgi:hypothetical protein
MLPVMVRLSCFSESSECNPTTALVPAQLCAPFGTLLLNILVIRRVEVTFLMTSVAKAVERTSLARQEAVLQRAKRRGIQEFFLSYIYYKD